MNSMFVSPSVGLLALLCGFVSCGRVSGELEPAPVADYVAKQIQLEIVAADRYLANVRKVGDDGQHYVENEFLLGSANSSTLSRLQEVVIHGPRVKTTLHGLDGMGYGGSCGCRPPEWIDCQLSNGQEIRIYIHHGKWSLPGEHVFRLDISGVEAEAILDRSAWKKVETLKQEAMAVSERVSSLMSKPPGGWKPFESSLMHEPGALPLTIESANCYALRPNGNIHIGQAADLNLLRLQEAVLGKRISTWQYMPSGEVRKVVRQDEATARIKCLMSDGQEVIVHVFSSDGSWFVTGEEGFRLDISAARSREILDTSGWMNAD